MFEMSIRFMDSKTIDILFKSWKEDVSHALEYNCDSHGGRRSLGQMQVIFKKKTGSTAVIVKCSPQANASLHTVNSL